MGIPTISMETQMLVKRLSVAEVGKIITWDELSKIIGKDVRGGVGNGANGLLQSARRICEREHGITFQTERGEGIRRLADNEIPAAVRSHIKSIHRKAGRGAAKLMCADPEKMDSVSRASYHMQGTMIHFLRKASSGHTTNRIAQRAQTETLTFDKTIKLFQ